LQAWRLEEYAAVVFLVRGLACLADRRDNFKEATCMLHIGIDASRRVNDRQQLAYFLNRLGGLLYAHGKYRQGWHLWRQGMQLATDSGSAPGLWEPLSSFAHITDIVGSCTDAGWFVETLQRTQHNNETDSLAVGLFVRGFYARLADNPQRAYDDLTDSLHLLSSAPRATATLHSRQLFMLVVQAELERVRGNYSRSQQYTETALALANIFSDRYTVATLLIDQGLFTFRQGQLADTHAAFLRLRDMAHSVKAPHPSECSRRLEQYLADASFDSRTAIPEHQLVNAKDCASAHITLQEPLSERELEVLALVAEGFSNREIAERLVITTATVKKHLEHIYTRLDVHNRTSAIACARTLKLFT
ncbi:MAG: response regulator transcription factor, partial [Ktedonobacteraceae bacterium]